MGAYVINLESLNVGTHNYSFNLDETFFTSLDYSDYEAGDFKVKLTLEKTSRHFEMRFAFDGTIKVVCDRCGDEFNLPMIFLSETILRYGDEAYEDDDLIVIEQNQKKIDLSHYLYESVVLNLPPKIIHPEHNGQSGCNQAMLKKIEALNKQKSDTIDPRWEALKKLK